MKSRIIEHESATDFLKSCAEWLSLREVENHGVLSLAGVLTSFHPIYHPPFLFAHAANDRGIHGCCIYAEPDGLVITDLSHQNTLILFEYLQSRIHIPSRIFGPHKAALQLGRLFGDIRRIPCQIQSSWDVHCLKHIEGRPLSVNGHIRIGTSADASLVSKWGGQYDDERPAFLSIRQFLLKKLHDQQLYLWADEDPKSLATVSGLNCSGLRISSVYTPPSHRSNGYATALVRSVSQNFLDNGRSYVTLNTQAGDPVERMYRRIGFQPVAQKVCVTFGMDLESP